MSKAQVKAVRRRMLESIYGAEIRHRITSRNSSSGAQVPLRVALECAQLLNGDIDKLVKLHLQWGWPTGGTTVPMNLSFSAYVRYVLRKERQKRSGSNRPYGRQP